MNKSPLFCYALRKNREWAMRFAVTALFRSELMTSTDIIGRGLLGVAHALQGGGAQAMRAQ